MDKRGPRKPAREAHPRGRAVEEVDEPVFYFRVDDDGGFSVHKDMFVEARWEDTASEPALIVRLTHVELSLVLAD